MKAVVKFCCMGACSLLTAGLFAQESNDISVQLHIEKATSLTGPWEVIPPDSMAPTGDGGMLDVATGSEAYYRLLIASDPATAPTLGMPLSDVPGDVKALATEHLESLRTEEPDWTQAVIGPLVIPVYNPAVYEGKSPAFYEFKIVGLSPQPEPPDQPAFGLSAPVDQPAELGFILVSAGRHDVPIPQYATNGATRCEQLRYRAQGTVTRFVRYSSAFWVAEDEKGQLRATLGSIPFRMPAEILDWKGKLPTTEVNKDQRWQESPNPNIKPVAYNTYADYRDDYVNGPVYKWLHEAKEKRAVLDWAGVDDQPPPHVQIPVIKDTRILPEIQIESFELEEPIAAAWIEPKGGLWLNGSLDGITLLTVIDTQGDVHYRVLVVGQPIEQLAGWRPWRTYYSVSACGWIPHYNQVADLPGCCTDGASGCGPTAWAMFYGFWDMRGAPNLIGGTEWTPYEVNADVAHCIQRTFALTGCWCTGIGGAAATNPWQMDDGDAYAGERGESITMSCSWCVPLTSSGPRRLAQNAIRYSDRPVIVGTGYFAHYPMAYAYRSRSYRAFGITWHTQHQWKVYQGWGLDNCEWVGANMCWFALDGYCY
jgi:hypothetical protein